MIIPCIDLVNGKVVKLVRGVSNTSKIKAGDPFVWLKRFAIFPTIAIIDIDAAKNKEVTNKVLIKKMLKYVCTYHPSCKVRVGGGIRDSKIAMEYINSGADKIIIGTLASPEFLKELNQPNRIMAALDCYNDEVLTDGWEKKSGKNIFEKLKELLSVCEHFFVTFVENEGMLLGIKMNRVKKLLTFIGKNKSLSVAGGIRDSKEICALDKLSVHSHVGMAVYLNKVSLGECVYDCCVTDRKDGLIPTIVEDVLTRSVIGFAYSSKESLKIALDTCKGVYYSRKRKKIWVKGETSGYTQQLVRFDLDCDKDCIKFAVAGKGRKFCHVEGKKSCFANEYFTLQTLFDIIYSRKAIKKEKSYTRILLSNVEMLKSKIIEEANELIECNKREDVVWESADLLYFIVVYCAKFNVKFNAILGELFRRNMREKEMKVRKKREGINFAIPKGRIKKNILKVFERMNVFFYFKNSRDYRPVCLCNNPKLKSFMNKCNFFITDSRNVITMIQSGYLEFGFSGLDLFMERTHLEKKIFKTMNLNYNKVDIVVAGKKEFDLEYYKKLSLEREVVVYSEYPKLTGKWIRKMGLVNFEVFFSFGSTEGLIPYVCDLIVCVKESGSTLYLNGLVELASITPSATWLFSSKEDLSEEEKVFIKLLKEKL